MNERTNERTHLRAVAVGVHLVARFGCLTDDEGAARDGRYLHRRALVAIFADGAGDVLEVREGHLHVRVREATHAPYIQRRIAPTSTATSVAPVAPIRVAPLRFAQLEHLLVLHERVAEATRGHVQIADATHHARQLLPQGRHQSR